MNYYKRHIGDYHKKAGRLTMLEHGSYTLLLDACYDRERFPTKEEAIDWCWARSAEEIAAVEFVLGKFFELRDGVYVQQRIQDEVTAYHAKANTNRDIALRRESAKRERYDHDSCSKSAGKSTNEHLTNNHEPITKNQKKNKNTTRASALPCPLNVDEQVWADFVRHRKAKRAEVTETALLGIEREARIAGITLQAALEVCCQRGWTGFKADWMRNNAAAQPSAVSSRQGRVDNYAAQAAAARGDHGRHDAIDAECTRIT